MTSWFSMNSVINYLTPAVLFVCVLRGTCDGILCHFFLVTLSFIMNHSATASVFLLTHDLSAFVFILNVQYAMCVYTFKLHICRS